MHSSARYTHGERENRWFHRRRKSNENLNDKIACFSVPRVRIGLKWSPAPSENCLKWIRKQQNFIQKPYRVHSSAVRTSWKTILCAFESWDRAWQHPNIFRTRQKSIRLQIYGFVPRRARYARASILRALRTVLLVEKKICKGVPRISKFYLPPVNGRMGHRYGAHLVRDGRVSPVGFANPRVELRVGAPCSQILNYHLPYGSCLRYCTF